MDSMAKLYDSVLNRRLSRWWKPEREQAGAQKRRGCLEPILTLRLLMDYAKSKRKILYVVYVDFSKAYDRVPKSLLLQKLIQLGCGENMLRAIASIYQCTRMIMRTAIITASIGVRQRADSEAEAMASRWLSRLVAFVDDDGRHRHPGYHQRARA